MHKGVIPNPKNALIEDEEIDYKDKKPMHKFIDNSKVQLVLLIVTLYSLFSDDYRILASKKHLDVIYDVFVIICLSVFSIEILIAAIWKPLYFNSYYFYLDIVSTASLILDFSPVSNALIRFSYTGGSGISRIGNLLRLIRLFRLVRISKIYKSLSASEEKKNPSEENVIRHKKHKTDSLVGRRLSETATRAVIVMCFLLLILLPLFTSDFWLNNDIGAEGAGYLYKTLLSYNFTIPVNTTGLIYDSNDNINDPANQRNMLAYSTKRFIDDFSGESSGILLKVTLPNSNVDYYTASNFSDYRLEEINVGLVEFNGSTIMIHQDGINTSILTSILNIIRTFYICVILLGGSNFFNFYTYKLIIQPIEDMTEKVRLVSERPQRVKEQAFIAAEEKEAKESLNIEQADEADEEEDEKEKSLETFIIKDAITKIGILLGVGLGEAGSSLIGTYLRNTKESDNDVLMKNVQQMDAIFGFCDIRKYTDATEVLQQEVMVFVNTIADIVHTIADRNLGAANKNVGDAFMVVWKIPGSLSAEVKYKQENNTEEAPPAIYVEEHNRRIFTNLADLALYAVMKMIAEINRSYELKYYADHKGLKKRCEEPGGPPYKPALGFGIHYGWAIEGAIGSFHKVDVSYLSPHVNIAGFLEGETKSYGAMLLISSNFYDLLTPEVKAYCRKIDILHTGDSSADSIMSVYTPNMTDRAFQFPAKAPLKQHVLKTKECYTFKKLLKCEILNGNYVGPSLFENDIDIRLLTCFNNQNFIDEFNQGFAALENSEWEKSKAHFQKALEYEKDKHTKTLLEYLNDPERPAKFPGYIGNMGGGH